MYLGYSEDKKALGYQVLKDTDCGIRLVLITNSLKKKAIKITIVTVFGIRIVFGNPEFSEAIGVNLAPQQIVKVYRPKLERSAQQLKTDPQYHSRVDNIHMLASYKAVPLIYLSGRSTYINEQLLKNLRAGDLSTNLTLVAIGVVVCIMYQLSGVDSFAIFNQIGKWNAPTVDPKFGLNPTYVKTSSRPGPGSALKITRFTAMPHQEFVGLTKEEKRQLPHPNDMTINHEGYPKLEVGFWQSKFKVGDHGAVHDLPYTVKDNGGTKTEKTNDNALKMMRSIVDMPNRDNVRWFEDGTYQAGTDREFEAIHIYDLDKQVIAVFKKSTGKFVTTCQLTIEEDAELKATGNFGGGKGWFSGQVKNLPPQQAPMDTFESDVMGITPIDNSQFDNP